ncbi:MAG: M56 family metallopeptidase [Lachnospiraceae bacterium]|nr:M56 family metallopeptidase [Lachnospiraceae bacterium]
MQMSSGKSDVGLDGETTVGVTIASDEGATEGAVVESVVEPVEAGMESAVEPDAAKRQVQGIMPLFSRVWAAGMALMLLYAGISSLTLRRKVAVRMPYTANDAAQSDGTGSVFVGGHGTKVYLTDGTDTPFILGILRPTIYLPVMSRENHSMPGQRRNLGRGLALTGQGCGQTLTEQEYRLILAHERAHIRNLDHLWKPLGFLLLSVYWFQPLLWVAYILFCRDIEFACDERVIRKMDSDTIKNYMETLFKCSTKGARFAACPLAFGEVGVKQRIKAVGDYKKPAFWIVSVGIIVCIAVAVTMLTVRKQEGTNAGEIAETAELLKPWAEAFLDKDTEVLVAHSTETVQKQMQDTLPLSFAALGGTGGETAQGKGDYVWKPADFYPWPQRAESYAPYQIMANGENRARIYYYAYDPDTLLMHVWVEDLEYEQKGSDFWVTSELVVFQDQIIDAPSALTEVFPGFDDTGFDYRSNGLGEKLLARYRKHDRSFYERLSSPMSALCQFLHLDENSVQIQVTNLGDHMICDVKFPGYDAWGNPVPWQGPVVCMTRYGADSGEAIWIPVNNPYTAEEVKEAALTLGRPENWPAIYSVSAELTGDGVADEVSLHYDAGYEQYNPAMTDPVTGDYERRVACLGGVVGAVVKDGDTGEILFRQTYSAAHVGNGVFALVHRGGRDYLLTGWCDQAFGESVTYAAEVFSWMNGEQVTADRYEGGFPIDRQEVYRGILRDGENFRFQNSKEVTDGLKELITKYEDGSQLLFAADNYLIALHGMDSGIQETFVAQSGVGRQYVLEDYYGSVWDRYRCEYTVRYPEENLYGKNVFSIEETGNLPNHIISFYEAESGEPLAQVWQNGGIKNGPYLTDLDHDGKNELISEVSWADGAADVIIFRERDGKVQIAGATDLIPKEMIPQMGGIGIVSAEYDPETKKITTYCWDGDLESHNRIKQEYEIGADILAQLQWWDWSEY